MASCAARELFGNRFVQAVMVSGIFLQIGIWVRNFAILLFVMDKTGNNPFAVSMIYLAEFVPIFLFSVIGGTFADRWRPRRTMIWCDLLSALSVFIVLLAMVYSTWQAVFFITFISAVLSQFSQPSAMKLFKVNVPGELLQMAMSMFQTLSSVFMILGPMLGTLVYIRFGVNSAIVVMGLAFLISAGALTFIPPDTSDNGRRQEKHIFREMADGFRYVLDRKELSLLGGIFIVSGLAVGIIQPLGVFIVTERLGLPKENLQWLMVVNGAAMLAGGLAVAVISRKVIPQALLAAGLLVSAISVVGVGLSTSWVITMSLQFLSGLFMPCIFIGTNTMILQITVEEFIGRVNGVLNPLFMGAVALTISFAGWLKAHLSLVSIYGMSGALFFMGTLLTVLLIVTFRSMPSGNEACGKGRL